MSLEITTLGHKKEWHVFKKLDIVHPKTWTKAQSQEAASMVGDGESALI